jgi:LSD1 subclass zinc finger protein
MTVKQSKPSADSSKKKPSDSQRPSSPSSSGGTLSSRISAPPPSSPTPSSKPQSVPPQSSAIGGQTDDAAARLTSLRTSWDRVAGTVGLASIHEAIDKVSSRVDTLAMDLDTVRARGYRYGRDWETQLNAVRRRWPQQRGQALQLLERERRVLEASARDVETMLQRANRDAGMIGGAQSRVSDLERSVSQAETRVRQTFDGVEKQAAALGQQIQEAKFVLDSLDSACFQLLPGEHPIAACRSTWTSDSQGPEGFFFLTDARIIFEQRQEVAAKKVLFITTKKELIQNKLWEAPVGSIDNVEIEDQKAFLQRREMLTLRFNERTREVPGDITLQLKGTTNEEWRTLLRRTKSGEIEGDRFGAPPPKEQLAAQVEAEGASPEKALPTVCPSCNAPLPAIFRGMKQVRCDYCDAVVNI